MSNGGSLWTDRLVNGESSNVNAAAAATGAVSGNIGEVEGGSCVGDGGGSDSSGGSSISSSSSSSSRSVSGVSCRIGVDCGSGSGSGSGDNTDCSGRSVPAVTVTAAIIGGTVGGASNGLRDRAVTLSDARGTTLAVNRCRETTVPRIRGGGGSAGDDNNDHVVATVDCHELGAIVSRVSSAGTIIPVNAGNVDYAQTVGNNSGTTANIATTAAAVVVVDTASTLFHDIADEDDEDEDEDDDGDGEDEDEENDDVNNDEDDEEDDSDDDDDAGDDDDDDDEEEEDEDQDEEDEDDEDDDEDDDDDEEEEEEEVDIRAPRYRQKHGNMVAAMNEHLSSTTTTTTSSPASANGARTSGSTVATLSSSSVMMTTSAIVSGNMNPTAMSTTTSTVMSSATIGVNNSNSCNNTRNQEFQEMDGDDGKTVATTTTTTGPAGILSFPCDFDHMYASMTDGGTPAAATATAAAAAAAAALGVSPLRGNEPRQNDLTEVKHLKELLLLHLDLIQQQSEQIVTKDKLLAALRQENETLKLRLERMERRVNLQKLRSECSENSGNTEHVVTCSPPSVNSVNTASTSELQRNVQSESSNTLHESFKIRLNTSGGITTVKQEPVDNQSKHEVKQEANETRFEWEEKKKRRSDPTPLSTGSKKKRGLSCSSTVNTDVSSNIQDKILSQTLHEASRKSDRKAKSLTKKESFLTTEEHYYTAVGDSGYTLSLKQSSPVETCSSLEVPNWRVKIYTSCYTMEGTENLDDEIFNKRHLKLENDERRRKRWDVQRIREQRHIEKLKQRQERQNHQATCYNTNHTGPCPSSIEDETITSLWPDVEQIQSLQVDPHLPVTAFGAPIPSFTPSEFSLPWSNITRIKCRRPKRSTSRRRSTGRRKV